MKLLKDDVRLTPS